MAIRAEESQVLQSVVATVPVYVMKREREGSISPLREPTLLAPVLFQTRTDEAPLNRPAIGDPAGDEELIRWDGTRSRPDLSSAARAIPRFLRESEVGHALRDGVASVVVALHLGPVVPPPELLFGLVAEPFRVVPDGWKREPENRCDLLAGVACAEQNGNDRPGARV